MAALVPIAPAAGSYALLTPLFAERLAAYAVEHLPHMDPAEFTRLILSRLWAGDQRLLALGLVDDGKLVGHLLAELVKTGESRHIVQVHQRKADQNVGDTLDAALDTAEQWGRQAGADLLVVTPHRDWKAWEKRGYELTNHTLHKRLKDVA